MIHKTTAKKQIQEFTAKWVAENGRYPRDVIIAKRCALPIPLVKQIMDEVWQERVERMYADYQQGKNHAGIAEQYGISEVYVGILFKQYGLKSDPHRRGRPRATKPFVNTPPKTIRPRSKNAKTTSPLPVQPIGSDWPYRRGLSKPAPKPPLPPPDDEKVYQYICRHIIMAGRPPTLSQIMNALLMNASEVQDALNHLLSEHRIEWNIGDKRGIQVCDDQVYVEANRQLIPSALQTEQSILEEIDARLKLAIKARHELEIEGQGDHEEA